MAATVPLVNKSAGDVLTSTLWNTYVVANLNKLLYQAHRKVTVAQFAALTGIEDGDEVYLEVDATNGVEWHLVYRSAEATYKWRYLGGPSMNSEVATSEATTSVTYAALTTAGPSITLPRAGDYSVELNSQIAPDTTGKYGRMSYDIGVTGAVDADAIVASTYQYADQSLASSKRKAALATGALVAKYKSTSPANTYFANRRMNITPVRLRHDA